MFIHSPTVEVSDTTKMSSILKMTNK